MTTSQLFSHYCCHIAKQTTKSQRWAGQFKKVGPQAHAHPLTKSRAANISECPQKIIAPQAHAHPLTKSRAANISECPQKIIAPQAHAQV